jgi:hypothetical protein
MKIGKKMNLTITEYILDPPNKVLQPTATRRG